jgi:predicted extracellular nuclease
VACSEGRDASAATAACRGEITPIRDIQGAGHRSPLRDTRVQTRGVVTRVEPGRGIFIEEPDDGADGRSKGLFVYSGELSQVLRTGQEIEVRGRVAELGDDSDSLTALIEAETHTVCAEDLVLPSTAAELPLDPQAREALEGMRLSIRQPLVVSDVYAMRRGEWTVSTGGPLRLPTEEVAPGREAAELGRRNRLRELKLALPGPDFRAAPAGAAVGPMQGVLGHDGEEQRFFPENEPIVDASVPMPVEPPAPGHIRIVSANLLNYFNGDGQGGGFPTERGAETPDEFRAQQERTGAALGRLQPDLVAVQELENDGFGPDSAAQSLLDLLNGSGESDWAFIDPGIGPIGGDVITVGLFYRRQSLEALGSPQLLKDPAFEGLSRRPLAQLFRDRTSGETILVASNHLKSKGRCPDQGPDSDQGDGQGCWNAARVQAVQRLTPWLAELAQEAGTGNILVLGDMNAWRQEDPIRAFRAAGYIELVEELSGLPQHSFLYYGQLGTLDYAFASPALRPSARQAFIWHINSDWPPGMQLPQPWLRMSDHDPVVVDVDFSHAATSD